MSKPGEVFGSMATRVPKRKAVRSWLTQQRERKKYADDVLKKANGRCKVIKT